MQGLTWKVRRPWDFSAETGYTEGRLERRLASEIAADPTVKKAATHQEAGALGGRGNKAGNNVNSFKGNSAAYLVRRLKRDAPEVATRLARGEFKSARAAARAAGLPIRETLTVPADDVKRAIKKLINHYTRGRREMRVFPSIDDRDTLREPMI